MSLALACLLASFPGPHAPAWLLRRLEQGLAGVCLMGDNVVDADQLAALIARLRSVRDGVVIALDEEGGDVTRVEMRTGSSYPATPRWGPSTIRR